MVLLKTRHKLIIAVILLLLFQPLSALAGLKDKTYGERIGIRIVGIDTAELKDKRPEIKRLARAAKQYTVERLREGKKIELRNIKRGKYFRIVAGVYVDGNSLAEELIKAGLAKPYDGGKKPKWLEVSHVLKLSQDRRSHSHWRDRRLKELRQIINKRAIYLSYLRECEVASVHRRWMDELNGNMRYRQ